MHALRILLVTTWLAGCVTGCSQELGGADAAAANPLAAADPSATSAASTGPVDNACALLTDAEIRSAFPKAQAGKRNTASLQYGVDRCAWETPSGQIGVEMSKVEAAAFEQELRAELQSAVDSRVPGALERIRFQSVPGIGDHAIAVLEKTDAQRGIYADISLLAIQCNHRMAVLMIPGASGDAALPTLDTLKNLGSPLAQRLQLAQ